MPLTLIVKEPFGSYERGDEITDPYDIASIRAGENALRVVQVSDEIVEPPPVEQPPSPLQGVLSELALLRQRVTILESRPAGNPDPPASTGQVAGAPLVDGDGSKLNDGDGDLLVR